MAIENNLKLVNILSYIVFIFASIATMLHTLLIFEHILDTTKMTLINNGNDNIGNNNLYTIMSGNKATR